MTKPDELFEGAVIGEKRFPFVRVTIGGQLQAIKAAQPPLRTILLNILNSKRIWIRQWKRFCRHAFQKTEDWRFFKLFPPKELNWKNFDKEYSGELQADFFGRFKDAQEEFQKHLDSVNNLKTETLSEDTKT